MAESKKNADSKGKSGGCRRLVLIAILILVALVAFSTCSSFTDGVSDGVTAATSSESDNDTNTGSDEVDDSSSEEDENPEPSFSEDEAMRALTVACSNGAWSIDAYADEDDDIDESTAPIGIYGALIENEMHPYDDSQSGSYLYGNRYDNCYAVDSDTWHIDGLTLESYENYLLTNYTFEVSGNVSFDGEYYWVSNVTMEYSYLTYDEDGNLDILGGTYEGTWCENEFSDEPFKVSPSLIEETD